jgi:hypothetical protein
MTETPSTEGTTTGTRSGFDVPPLRRLRYFHGQMLSARDFQREQEYLREQLKLRMRSVLGYGVVTGLLVEPVRHHDHDHDHDDGREHAERQSVEEAAGESAAGESTEESSEDHPAADHPAADQTEADRPEAERSGGSGAEHERRRAAKVRLTPGLAMDCDGNQVVVREDRVIDLWHELPRDERDCDTVWVGVEYCERPVEPTRAVYDDGCADTPDCEHGYVEESWSIRVTGHRPPADERCDSAGGRCHHRTLWLARIDDVDRHRPVRRHQVHQDVRRPFGRHVPTVITGINWIHGHTYSVDEAKLLLGTQDKKRGLRVEFSDDVRVDCLDPGVVDVQVIEGGAGRNASTWYMGAEFVEPGGGEEFTRAVRFRQTTRETLQDGDRVMITIRAAFLLDRCCRPVDGTHVGGRVPTIEPCEVGELTATERGCAVPPSGVLPWTSGTGSGGDVFESWFFVRER